MGWRMARQLAAALMAAALAHGACAAPAGEWTLGPDGFGPLRIGMRFEQVRALAPGLVSSAPALRPTPGCDQLPLPGHRGVWLMFVNDVLRRVDIAQPGIRTSRGIKPGDAVARFEQAYPGARRSPDAYDDSEVYLTVGPRHGRALRAETEQGKIKAIYAGYWTEVQYTEGCL